MSLADLKLFKKGDVLFWLLLTMAVYFFLFSFRPETGQSSTALIQIDNQIKYELNLERENTILLDEFNPPIKVMIHDNRVSIIENNCPQKICMRMGAIAKPGATIVCVPKKVLIYIPYSYEPDESIKAITG
jgi:hypothetical protein